MYFPLHKLSLSLTLSLSIYLSLTHTHSLSPSLSLTHTLSLKPLAWNKIYVLQDKACQNNFYIFSLYVYYKFLLTTEIK